MEHKIDQTEEDVRTTYGVWIGDVSGSMNGLEKAHSKGYNTFIEEQQKEKGQFFLTTIRFNDEVNFVGIKNTPIDKIEKATEKTFKARGSTALYDAIGTGIQHMLEIYNKNNQSHNSNYIIIIMTDGCENSSKRFTKKQIKKMIKDCKMKDISVKFTGANQEAESTGDEIGLDSTQCATFEATPIGMTELFRSVSNTVIKHRLTGSSEFTETDKKRMLSGEIDNNHSLPKFVNLPPPPSLFKYASQYKST